jgi:hypothetical protein
MKTMKKLMMGVAIVLWASSIAQAQKIDDERMNRDISVAENVLSTLIKQQFSNQKTFFTLEVRGSYQEGYGVTFTLPADYTTPILFSVADDNVNGDNITIWNGFDKSNMPSIYTWPDEEVIFEDEEDAVKASSRSYSLKERGAKTRRRVNMDSIRDNYNLKVIEAAKTFIVDYGDMITQLSPNEKIIITNQGSQPRVWVNQYFTAPKRKHLSVEGQKSDLVNYKQGKVSRDQALKKINVVNTETTDTVEPDLELLSSIFNRLYQVDLSKTFFMEDNIYYERLKDFGIVYYMQVFSSHPIDYHRYAMPTLGLEDVDEPTRNKKVVEVYPKFEKELLENILDYGRTLKSIKPEESLVFQVKVTRCNGCGIPSSLEYNVKGSVLQDYASGKIEKNSALAKINVKKGPKQ